MRQMRLKVFNGYYILLGMLIFFCCFISGCAPDDTKDDIEEEKKEETTEKDSTTQQSYTLKKAMRYYLNSCFPYYYWYDEMNPTVSSYNLTEYKTIDSFFEATLYSRDHWSWMALGSYFAQSETGEYEGTWGASLKQQIEYYNDYDIRVAYVFPGSPFDQNGVKRGWVLTELAGRPVMDRVRDGSFYEEYAKSPQTFTFMEDDGTTHTFTAELESIITGSVLKKTIFWPTDFPGLEEPVGYFNYLTFNANMLDDIHDAMSFMKEADVHKLILDLRYNGGGDSRASQLLIDYLAPQSADKKPYVHRHHNRHFDRYDVIDSISRMPGSLDLDAIYVIGLSGTASASEMIINGLKPYIDLTLVGDTTYGKPNGMYVFMYPDDDANMNKYNNGDYSGLKYAFLPICFYNMNGVGEFIPDDGFIPDNYRPDDLTHDFGVDEDLIKACLTRISGGDFPELPKPKYYKAVTKAGFNKSAVLKERRSPLYGLTIEPFPGQMAIE